MPSRVLIAEEQTECCQLFRQFLQRCGYDVAAVHDGMGCIEVMQDGFVPNVIVLSWELPWGEGEGVLDWLQQRGSDGIAVVVLTARMDPNAVQQEDSLPRVTWLQRPFRLTELLSAVQSAERVPRNSWRCLEPLLKKKKGPEFDVLLNSMTSTCGSPPPVPVTLSDLPYPRQRPEFS